MTRWADPVPCIVKRCGCAWILETGDQVIVCCPEHRDAQQLKLPFAS